MSRAIRITQSPTADDAEKQAAAAVLQGA